MSGASTELGSSARATMALAGRRTHLRLLASAGLAALVLAYLAGRQPALAVAAGGGLVVVAIAFAFPVVLLTLILVTATIVPYDLQNRFGFSVGGGSSGLVLTDVLILTGLGWAALATGGMVRGRMRPAAIVTYVLLLLFLALVFVQALHGFAWGRDPGTVGYELRQMLGLSVFLIALPLLLDPQRRPRVLRGLVVVGLLLGLWGTIQWVLTIPPSVSEDVGVRQGVSLTTSGAGQILGGRYAFPAAAVLAFAALVSARPRSGLATVLLLVVLMLNTVSLVLTYERAFWVASALAVLVVVVRAGHVQRARALVWGTLALVLVATAFSAIAPGQATAVRERLLSLGQYQTDESVDYRLIESRHVVARIRDAEVVGSGLGATIYWGRPSYGVPPTTESYSHNAYLRAAWKLGIPGALLLVAVFAAALLGRRVPGDLSLLRSGARAALVATLIMGASGPVFDTLNASAVLGLLLALALSVPREGDGEPGEAGAPHATAAHA